MHSALHAVPVPAHCRMCLLNPWDKNPPRACFRHNRPVANASPAYTSCCQLERVQAERVRAEPCTSEPSSSVRQSCSTKQSAILRTHEIHCCSTIRKTPAGIRRHSSYRSAARSHHQPMRRVHSSERTQPDSIEWNSEVSGFKGWT